MVKAKKTAIVEYFFESGIHIRLNSQAIYTNVSSRALANITNTSNQMSNVYD